MLLHFYSDVAYNMTGFNITFNLDSCPSEYSDLTCSGHGFCVRGICQCDEDFKGPACSVPACPNSCHKRDRKGTCNKKLKRCDCEPGYKGESCSQAETEGYWTAIQSDYHATSFKEFAPRASHVSLVDENNIIWIIGGETFTYLKHIVSTITPNFNTGSYLWNEIRGNGDKGPSPRYGHSAVLHDGKIYMYGGTMRSGHTSKEIWAFDIESLIWRRISTQSGTCKNSGSASELCGPMHVTGHTATVISNRMIVIFGHSPTYGYLNYVQGYHFGNKEWSIVNTIGYPVKGGFGHSASWDKLTNLIFVHGGYINGGSSATLADTLYSYNPIEKRWTIHRSSGSFRYLHSSVVSNGLLFVFGGNTHNDTSYSQGALCYSMNNLIYDISCDRWYNMPHIPFDLNTDIPRFGHSSVIYNESVLIYGGFNGKLKNDLLSFVPGRCDIHKSRDDCLNATPGIKCVWIKKKSTCEVLADLPANKLEFCAREPTFNYTRYCSHFKTCSSCLSTSADCVWCGSGECSHLGCHHKGLESPSSSSSATSNAELKKISTLNECLNKSPDLVRKERCGNLYTCQACEANSECQWMAQDKNLNKCKEKKKLSKGGNLTDERDDNSKCSATCNDLKNCTDCTSKQCMWCSNLDLCVDRNAYLSSFPYGQCMDWTTNKDQCPKNSSLSFCSSHNTCESCRNNPRCGWCDDGSNTGLGVCHVGGAKGPMENNGKKWALNQDTCDPNKGKSWHFVDCNSCQCNGHSSCTRDPNVCDKPCSNHSEGTHCQRCSYGYFGKPVNGGICEACKCNGRASNCNHLTGQCHCTTKGIIGDSCENCDKSNHYYGNPKSESCFYDLAIDYQFTFNLSKPEDRHYRAINFKNVPTKQDVDVDFSVECSVPAKMNLTYRYYPKKDSKEPREEVIFSERNCSEKFKHRFSKNDFSFGSDSNTTFFVYIYDFQPPLWIVISFSQHPKLDLLQFFITFSTCFLALLLVAAILWKVKQKYDRYRRRQRLFVEMEQMASRPFGSVFMDMERLPDNSSSEVVTTRRRKKQPRPSPIALEPCFGNRAAVLSLIVRLPTGGKPYAPNGYTGMAVASSLVTLGNQRKPSTDLPPSRPSCDDHKGRENRKSRGVDPTVSNTPAGGSINAPTDL